MDFVYKYKQLVPMQICICIIKLKYNHEISKGFY